MGIRKKGWLVMKLYQYAFNKYSGILDKTAYECKETNEYYIINSDIPALKHRIFKPAVKVNIIENKSDDLVLYSLDDSESNAKNIILAFLNEEITKHIKSINYLASLAEKLDAENAEPENELSKYIAIDFDGTITVKNAFPEVGEPNWLVINKAKDRAKQGNVLILYTCREGIYLEQALQACKDWDLPITYANENPECEYNDNQRKIVANEYWDDRAVNVTNGRLYPEKLAGHNRHVCVTEK